ncbi:hypothetical protein FBULB1_2195 [Fusarium bulbicola]|nr:hypothetical protein FBULB1_2195 [Fusarium bulbicola]
MMEDLHLQIAELRQRQRDEYADITGLKSDVAHHKAKALVMEMKLCELEKERQENNEKIVKIDKDIEDIQGDVSAINEKIEVDDTNLLQAREDQEDLAERLDAIDENQEEQKRQHEETTRKISEDLRRAMAEGLMQGLDWE